MSLKHREPDVESPLVAPSDILHGRYEASDELLVQLKLERARLAALWIPSWIPTSSLKR